MSDETTERMVPVPEIDQERTSLMTVWDEPSSPSGPGRTPTPSPWQFRAVAAPLEDMPELEQTSELEPPPSAPEAGRVWDVLLALSWVGAAVVGSVLTIWAYSVGVLH